MNREDQCPLTELERLEATIEGKTNYLTRLKTEYDQSTTLIAQSLEDDIRRAEEIRSK